MNLFATFFWINLKDTIKNAILLLLVLSLMGSLAIVTLDSEEQQIPPLKIAIVNEDSNPLTQVIFNMAIQQETMADTLSITIVTDETALTDTYAAVVTLPDGFIDSIMSGENLPPTVVLNTTSPMENMIVRQMADAGARYLSAGQAGIYGVLRESDYGDGMSNSEYQELIMSVNLVFLDTFVQRLDVLDAQALTLGGPLTLIQYISSSLVATLLLMYSFLFQSTVTRSKQLSKLFYRKKSVTTSSFLSCFSAIFLAELSVFLVVILFMDIAFSMSTIFLCLLFTLLASSFSMAISTLFPRPYSAIFTIVSVLVMALISGGLFPAEMLPASFEHISALTVNHYGMRIMVGLWGYPLLLADYFGAIIMSISLLSISAFFWKRTNGKEAS